MTNNLWKRLEGTAAEYRGKTAIRYLKDGSWTGITYDGLRDRIRSLSPFLLGEGIKKGDRVGILMENRPEWPVVFFSVLSVGGVVIPLNTDSPAEEIGNILSDSGTVMLFTGRVLSAPAGEILSRSPSVKKVISVDSPEFAEAAARPGGAAEEETAAGDLACILYTSGTTQAPKGVMLTHGNLLSNCRSLFKLGIVTPEDSIISILPLFHTYPLTSTVLLPLLYGGTIIYPGTMRGEEVLAAMRETRPTVFVAVPQIYHSFHRKITEALKKVPFPLNLFLGMSTALLHKLRKATGINLSRYLLYGVHKKFGRAMRLFISGGAKLDEDVGRDLFRLGFTILEGYGLTETSPVLTFNPQERPKTGSVGLPVPDVEIKIDNMNEEGVGEVLARGPNVMKGYHNRPGQTASVLKDGWFHTGDLGYLDEDGYLFLTGRAKDVIVLSSGVNVYPEEVEEAYMAQAPVSKMCVFDLPQKKGKVAGLALWAVVVPDLGFFRKYGEVNLRAVIKERFDNVSRALPPYKRLMGFTITLDELPHTPLGKIKRYAVKEIYTQAALQETPEAKAGPSPEDLEMMSTETGKRIIRYLEDQTRVEGRIMPADLLELDLGIDSLGRIELAAGLEQVFGIKIEDEIIGRSFTVRDLITGIEPLLREKESRPVLAGREAVVPESWKRTLDIPPEKENLDKIDLDPGPISWFGGFMFICLNKVFFRIFNSLSAEGQGNIPKHGPFMMYVNHTSYFDGLVVASTLPRFPRLDLFFVGFRPYFNVPVIRNLIKIGRIIPLDFSAHLLEAMRSCYYVLKNGKALCLFPEGLRTLDGRVGVFKKGFGILAKETNAQLVPVVIEGAFRSWPRTSKFPKRHPIKVIYGEPLDVEKAEREGLALGAKDSYEAICLGARAALVRLQQERRP